MTTTLIDIKPEMIDWAIQHARLNVDAQESPVIQTAYQWIQLPSFPYAGTPAKHLCRAVRGRNQNRYRLTFNDML